MLEGDQESRHPTRARLAGHARERHLRAVHIGCGGVRLGSRRGHSPFARSPGFTSVGGSVRVDPAMFCCGSLSDWRSRSICVLRLSGNFRSISNEARRASPISRTIARLCEWSMSMEFRMTAFSLRKTPLEPDIKVEGPLQFCRRSKRRPSPLAIVRERWCP